MALSPSLPPFCPTFFHSFFLLPWFGLLKMQMKGSCRRSFAILPHFEALQSGWKCGTPRVAGESDGHCPAHMCRPEGKFVDLFDRLPPRPDAAWCVILVAAATYQKRFKNFSPGRHFFFGSQSTCGLGSDRLIHLLLAGYHMSTLPAMHTLRRLDGWRRQFRQ